jgi:hypothetical protein
MATLGRATQCAPPKEQLQRLERDLASGNWERRNAELRHRTDLDIGYRLVVAERRGGTDIQLPRDG